MKIEAFLAHIDDQRPLTTDEEISRFEKTRGFVFPSDYRLFLQRCNGGYIGGSVWDFEHDAGVHHIGGFRTEDHFSLPRHCESIGRFLPADIIPIADDPFGNAICIGIRGDAYGKIFFWDHESAYDEPMRIADSFTQFVENLEVEEE